MTLKLCHEATSILVGLQPPSPTYSYGQRTQTEIMAHEKNFYTKILGYYSWKQTYSQNEFLTRPNIQLLMNSLLYRLFLSFQALLIILLTNVKNWPKSRLVLFVQIVVQLQTCSSAKGIQQKSLLLRPKKPKKSLKLCH